MVVGIAGKYCAGKNTVSRILEQHGYQMIDVDKLGHQALSRKKEEIAARFGELILTAEGDVDRKRLGEIVFENPEARRDLEEILHPAMVSMVEEEISRDAATRKIINAALLFPMKLDRLCDRVLWVTAPLFVRVKRAWRRDHLPLPRIVQRMWSQRNLTPQPSASDVDIHTVENPGNTALLVKQLGGLGLLKDGEEHGTA